MKLALTGSGVLAAAAIVAGGVLAWRVSKSGALASIGQAWDSAAQTVEQAQANVQSAWVNNVQSPFMEGWTYGTTGEQPAVSEKAWLYSDYGYTGNDPGTGQPIVEGEWYGDAVARRYEAEQREAGTAPTYTTSNGAAFGIYPRP